MWRIARSFPTLCVISYNRRNLAGVANQNESITKSKHGQKSCQGHLPGFVHNHAIHFFACINHGPLRRGSHHYLCSFRKFLGLHNHTTPFAWWVGGRVTARETNCIGERTSLYQPATKIVRLVISLAYHGNFFVM